PVTSNSYQWLGGDLNFTRGDMTVAAGRRITFPSESGRKRLALDTLDVDYRLARSVAGGNLNALGELYERHFRQVYAVCLSMTRNPSEAEDLTQDVFVHLVRKIGSYRG